MATLTVLEFDSADGADQMIEALGDMQRQRLLTLLDAAIVSWPTGARKPRTRQLTNVTATSAMGGAFWGLLFGPIFFNQVRDDVTEGTSALFLLTADEVPDKMAEEIRARDLKFKIVASNLTREQEDTLQEIFRAA